MLKFGQQKPFKITRKIQKFKFCEALELIKMTQSQMDQEIRPEYREMKIVKIIESQYENFENAIWEILDHHLNLTISNKNFNSDVYNQIAMSHIRFNKDDYCEVLMNCFEKQINSRIKITNEKYGGGTAFINFRLKDICNGFAQILYNHRLIFKYHQT